MPATRHFLGWDRSPLPLAADWLIERFGSDLSRCVLALPGARAGRRLRGLLAERLGPAWIPPRFVTAGTLTDELLTLDRPQADRLARTLAWERALRGLPRRELERVASVPPERDDRMGWLRLAGEVRALFGELAAECLSFHDVEEGPARRAAGAGEGARWAALSRAQADMLRHLEEQGLADPHVARLHSIEAGRVDRSARVVLIGVVELNGLTRRLLPNVDVDCLVLAPEEREAMFDELGCVVPEAWEDHTTDLRLEDWHVVEQPVQQAERALECVAGWGRGRYCAEQVTLGVARESVAPYLRRQLAARGLVARDARGTPVLTTPPARLLSAVSAHLRRPVFETFAALVRHVDVERSLRKDEDLKDLIPAGICDDYQPRHVPHLLGGPWPADPEDEKDVHQARTMKRIQAGLERLLGGLARPERRPLAQWIDPLRRLLDRVYGGRPLDPEADEEQRRLVEGLAATGEALGELEEVPAGLAPDGVRADEVVELLLLALGNRPVPPRPQRPGEPTVELLGWLELPLDDAPALVVTGFDEGCVPEAVHGHAWLPDSVRTELGMADNRHRLARDLYAVDLLVHSRERVAFVSGRRTLEGDPVLPSRIAFHRSAEELPEWMRRALPERSRAEAAPTAGVDHRPLPFVPGLGGEPERWSASAFKIYLDSPYLFWLQKIARKNTVDDRERELGPLPFGILTHAVLEDLGRGELRDSTDEGAIADFLVERLEARARERFGEGTYPAVRLQLRQLEYRLRRLAACQARRATEGWRIEHVEWKPPEDVELDVPGGPPARLTGKIDRIDRHPDGRWAVLDYKTTEDGKAPDKAHRRAGEWRDVQLPLYALLAREIVGQQLPELDYVTIGRKPDQIGFQIAQWSQEEMQEAVDVARDVVVEVRRRLAAGEPFPHGDGRVYEPILQAIVGEHLIGAGREA